MTTTETTAEMDLTEQEKAEAAGLVDMQAGIDAGLYVEINGEMIELTEHGVEVARAHDLDVDVDAYGCAYVVGIELR